MGELPDLDRLIAAVAESAATDEPLARLAAAVRARDELDALTEALLDHFIEEARQAGCSWSQIGNVLGVSKQAAQQRHTATQSVARQILTRLTTRASSEPGPGLFTRFTPRARAAVAHAQDAARRLRHGSIGTEHVLLGLMAEPEGIAARALAELGLDEAAVELAVADRIGPGNKDVSGHIPFSPRAKKVLELSLREAVTLEHNYIGTEHILLGLLRADGVAAELLAERGAGAERVRPVIMRLLGEVAV